MFLTLAGFELKNLLRDKMTAVMIIYPLFMGVLGKLLLVRDIVGGRELGLIVIFLAIVAGFAYGAMAGFSLLDDRDDQVFASLSISPVPLTSYIWFKVLFATLLAALSGLFLLWYPGAVSFTALEMVTVACLAALQTPFTAFIVNAFARNKVEGFVTMKAAGFLLLLPLGSYFFLDAKEWLFAIAPGHWAAKAVQSVLLAPQIEAGLLTMNMGFYGYLTAGVLYNLLLVAVSYRLFYRRVIS